MDDRTLDFASLLCSRLCHDLLSPVGALGNGLELLVEETDPGLRRQYLDLVADSARASADKLRFFRLAFGATSGFGERIATNETRAALEGIVRGNRRLALGWLVEAPELDRATTRLLLALAMIALDALARGGRLDVCLEGDEIVLRAEGPRVAIDADVLATLEGGDRAACSRTVTAALARTLAAGGGRAIQLAQGDGVLVLGASGAAQRA